MLIFRAFGLKKTTNGLKSVSRNFLLLPKTQHLPKQNVKYFHKLSCCQLSRFDHLNHSRLSFSCYSTNYGNLNRPSDEESSIKKETTYVEHPDVANRSSEEVEEYRQKRNIIVKGDNVPRPITQFSELYLPEILSQVLSMESYSEPTAIQSQGWPVAFSHRDMVGVSQTGSGKTLAYMLPAVVHASDVKSKNQRRMYRHSIPLPKVLVLGPTRELVQQILQVSRKFIEACNLRGACVYGGASRGPQLNRLQGAEICIATPGRLLDYLENRETKLDSCTYLVLDEADRMLDMGFEPQIRQIIDQIPNNRQTLMWSATWPKEIRILAEEFLQDYIHITVGDTELVANPNIHQNIYVMKEDEKFEKLLSLVTSILENQNSKILVFAETKRKVNFLTDLLKEQRVDAWGIHGDCTQYQRDRILNNFRTTTPSVLIATDIASRGLDISDIHHVINYDFPTNIEDYIHRIGRTARGYSCGEAHSFFTPDNAGVLKDLLSVLKKANQEINPELLTLKDTSMSKSFKFHKRYNYNKSFDNYGMNFRKNRMARDRTGYGDRMRNDREGTGYGDRMRNDSDRTGYGERTRNERDRTGYRRNRMEYGNL